MATEEYILQEVLRPCKEILMPHADEDDKAHHKMCLEISRDLGISCLDFLEKNYVQTNTQILNTHLESIRIVCDTCKRFYEEGSSLHSQFRDLYSIVWNTMGQRLGVNQIDEEGSVGSDEWEQSDAELSTSSLIAEDRDVISLLDNTADL